MSLKKEIKREIAELEDEIKELEIKRSRSVAALLDSLISRETPKEAEVQFFRHYNAEIDLKREKLTKLNNHLKKLV